MLNPIKIQILLRREWQTPDGIEKTRNCLVEAGLRPTAAGRATISAELDPDHFQFLFGTPAKDLPRGSPAAGDFGRSGGQSSEPLQVPRSLERYIEAISVAPGHTYLED
jgi:hypothetical protein